MFSRISTDQLDRMIGRLTTIADEQAKQAKRLARIETRLYLLAKALGHEDAMHKDTDDSSC